MIADSGATTAGAPAVPAVPTFEEFWLERRDPIGRALAMTIGNAQLAAEAVDEAMARALQRWPQVSEMPHPSAWVYRVGLNWSRSIGKRVRRRPPIWLASAASSVDADTTDPSIDAALAALPLAQRSVVVCRLLLGLSEAQTAEALRLRPGTVKSRLSRAVDQLSTTLAHLDPKETDR
ncbi:MAG: sigma factor-like helix-turn-helix DNA-binding protein [Actinomycetota bacterium]|nr:sigma factor-like helix-turn-helix DNA-binding protein [Actinomycetota bacterium]